MQQQRILTHNAPWESKGKGNFLPFFERDDDISSQIWNHDEFCQSIYRISDYTRSFIKDESPTRL